MTWKTNKIAEEKELRVKLKKADKKRKSLLEREAKIELTKNKNARKLEDDQNNSCLILLENNISAETGSLKPPD